MKKIGLISDTHGYLDPELERHFGHCDEIWHAGDIGTWEVIEELESWGKKLRVVFGNIDGHPFRRSFQEELLFEIEGLLVFMVHIAGSPGKYHPAVRNILTEKKPGLLVCGHSHILKVMFDQRFTTLYMNPGASGKHGFHRIRTALRFGISEGRIVDLEAIELGLRGALPPS